MASPRADRVRGRKGEHKTYCMYNYSYSHSISNWPAQVQALTSASARKGEHQGLVLLKKQLLTVLFMSLQPFFRTKVIFTGLPRKAPSRPVLPFCPFWLHTFICLNSPELHCWLSSHPHCIKMTGLVFSCVCSSFARSLERTLPKYPCPEHAVVGKVCLVTSPKTVFVCIWLLLIVSSSFARSLGWPCPRQHAQGMPSWVRCSEIPNLICS